MLGEDIDSVELLAAGVEGDRVAAVIDIETGMVASAKRPTLWRELLQCSASTADDGIRVRLPDGVVWALDDRGVDAAVSEVLGRTVRLTTTRPPAATLARPTPEAVIEAGVEADVPYTELQIGDSTPGDTFVDAAPIHLFTTATLAAVGAELVRYRPNLVLDLPDSEAYAENTWAGRELVVGSATLRILRPTQRCAVPTLAHGDLPRRTDAVRTLMQHNRVEAAGSQPCLGAYAEVVRPGRVCLGDRTGF
jgi:uncharacterized protein YcbX